MSEAEGSEVRWDVGRLAPAAALGSPRPRRLGLHRRGLGLGIPVFVGRTLEPHGPGTWIGDTDDTNAARREDGTAA